ncbi:MAG: DUF2779 domain-containing protein [Bdellovibrionales bacterium]|nr:DUF2779 domain-containing protein [Bdellovibrionales bacterium]
MKSQRYLTKSRFKLGMECPTKLYYTKKPEYPNQKMDDKFLAALADGGYQVGELAKLYFPNGHDITTLDYEEAEKQTLELLKKDEVIIYEPAIKFKNLFIRIDILVKKGNQFQLIEVKSKSFDVNEERPFLSKKGTIQSSWKSYLYDIAFQKYVLTSAYPNASITSFLMMVDKNAKCPIEGLNQKFKVIREANNRKGIKVSNTLPKECLNKKILVQVPVDEVIQLIYGGIDSKEEKERNFFEEVSFLATKYESDEKIISDISSKCAKCEFTCSKEDEQNGFKNGFKECWSSQLNWSNKDFEDESVLKIWNFRKKDELIKKGKIKLIDLNEDDISPKQDEKPGISTSQRQWLQVEMAQRGETKPFLDIQEMKNEMDKWIFPLHFIDFETSSVAFPFNKGRKPYEGIAFQFSHHIVREDGTVEHAGQYLNTKQGIFPNYEFVRQLKSELEKDNGTIFRYASHENTYLNKIYRQLIDDPSDIPDRKTLCEFIKSITKSNSSNSEKWEGERSMVDMCELVKRFFYDPYTKGSNSIKQVLPAVLNFSAFLQEKYSQPIYGSPEGIKSLNFKDWKWIEWKEGNVVDPYKKLPKMFQDVSDKNMNLLSEEDELSNGGAALTAYGRMQFSEISEYEKKELEQALLKYCELDTLAMVMIYEAWRDILDVKLKEEKLAG